MDLRDEYERTGDQSKLASCVSNQEIEQAAKKYAFQGFVVCSAKEKKGLNKVFHTAFKVVFQMKAINNPTAGGGQNTSNPGPIGSGPTPVNPKKKGGCCK